MRSSKSSGAIDSDYPLTRISPEGVAAVHSYFDLIPESPDGQKVIYYAFESDLQSPGRVVLTDPDGKEHRTLEEGLSGSVHSSVFEQWVDNNTVCYVGTGKGSRLKNVDNGEERDVPGRIRMVSPDGRLGLWSTGRGSNPCNLYTVDLVEGKAKKLFDTMEILENHPQKGGNFDPAKLYIKHTKWSYAGDKFIFVFTNGTWPPPKDEDQVWSVMIADRDGSNLRHFADAPEGMYWGHTFWDPSGDSVWGVRFPGNLWLPEWYLTSLPLDGGPERSIHMDLFGNHAQISPDGKMFAVDVLHGPEETGTGVFLLDARTEEWNWLARYPIPGMVTHPHPVWSRDGKRVYFNVLEGGMPAVYAADVL